MSKPTHPPFDVVANQLRGSVWVTFDEAAFVRPAIAMLVIRPRLDLLLCSFERQPLTPRALASITGVVLAYVDSMIQRGQLFQRYDGLWEVVTPRERLAERSK